jgi:hypothetical protein
MTHLAGGAFRSLRVLHLAHGGGWSGTGRLNQNGLKLLADEPTFANLRVLTVSFTGVSDAGVDFALNAPHWRLSGLGVAGCDLSPDAV